MFITVAAATLPSVPLDFLGNRDRIIESIRIAKAKGATVRAGPELEVPGRVVALFYMPSPERLLSVTCTNLNQDMDVWITT